VCVGKIGKNAPVNMLPKLPILVKFGAVTFSLATNAVAVAISQSTGTVTIFREGTFIASLPRATGWSQLAG
jgi:hypothetical protein